MTAGTNRTLKSHSTSLQLRAPFGLLALLLLPPTTLLLLPLPLPTLLLLMQVNKLVREIEVSHWGNIYVEDTYEIVSHGQLEITDK